MNLDAIKINRGLAGYDVGTQLVDALRALIMGMSHGDALPSTQEIATRASVAKATVTEALDRLAGEGHLQTRSRGRAMRVRRAPVRREISTDRYATELARLADGDGSPSTALLRDVGADWSSYSLYGESAIIDASANVAELLHTPPGTPVWRRRVIETLDGVAMCVRVTCVIAANLDGVDLSAETWRHDGGALAEFVAWFGHRPDRLAEWLRHRAPTGDEVRDLAVDATMRVAEITRQYWRDGHVMVVDERVIPDEGITWAWDTRL